MNRFIIVTALFLAGCQSFASDKVSLSTAETKQCAAIIDEREQLFIDRQNITIDYQNKMNALNVKEGDINNRANQLGYKLKKAHNVPVGDYQLDEQHAVLVKVK